jgi:hypothetical protein
MTSRYGTPCGHYTAKVDAQDTHCGAKPTRHFLMATAAVSTRLRVQASPRCRPRTRTAG